MQSISEIKEILGNCSMEELPEQIKQFEEDSRKGVQTALASFRKKYEKYQLELERLEDYEKWFAYYNQELYFPYDYEIWQYSHTGRVNGIKGEVDRANASQESIMKLAIS